MAPPLVLVLNAGSSSLKFEVLDPARGASVLDGHLERIGTDGFGAALTEVADRVAGAGIGPGGLRAVGHRVVHGGPGLVAPTLVDDAVVRRHRGGRAPRPAAQPARPGGHPAGPVDLPGRPAGGGVRHRVLPRPAGPGRDLRPRPRDHRAPRDPALRHARHQPRARRPRGRRPPRPAGGGARPGRAAPRERRVGLRDRRRAAGGHVDGAHPARGTGDGHPGRRPGPGGAAAPAAPRGARRRRARGPAAPRLRAAGDGRPVRLP